MLLINYPEPQFRIRQEQEKDFIFDGLRKKWLLLTPEEWVRQNFVQYLIQVKKYPATLIAMEKKIALGEMTKRFDILVYDPNHRPWVMIECKAPSVILDQTVIAQVLRYHISVPAGYLVVTNGDRSYAWEKKEQHFVDIDELPHWHFQ
jgi:hypothetical protein